MSKNTTRILALILAAVVFGGAFYIYYSKPFSETPTPEGSSQTEEAQAQPVSSPGEEVTPVRAMVIRAGSLRDAISVNGSTVPEAEVTVTSEVPGKITEILFNEGSWVKEGTPLVHLDDDELQAQRERLVVRRVLTRNIAERMKGLYQKEGVSLQEYEIAEAEAEQVEAELALIDVQISKRTIKAPFSGVLGLKQVSEGSYLSPGTPVISLVSTNPIHLEFSVPEKYSRSIDKGGVVDFQIDGVPESFKATVIAKEPNIDPDTRTLRLKATAPNPGGKILPGAYANVTVNLKSYEATIMVPTQAIVPELGGKKVFVYRDGTVEAVPVETGIRQDVMIQVLEGLEEGDTIITTGVLQIRPGTKVTISQMDQPGAG
jgi:membrane fusion protein (multidrug efflux system)